MPVHSLRGSRRTLAIAFAGTGLLHCAGSEGSAQPPTSAPATSAAPVAVAPSVMKPRSKQARQRGPQRPTPEDLALRNAWSGPAAGGSQSSERASGGVARWSRRGSFAVRLERGESALGASGSPFAQFNRATVASDSAILYAKGSRGPGKPLKCCADDRCHESIISEVAFTPDERLLILGGPRLCVYSLPGLGLLATSGGARGATAEGISDLAISPRGSPLVQGASGTLQILDIGEKGQLSSDPARAAPRLHLLEGARVAFNPEGWQVASGGAVTGASRGSGMEVPSAERITFWNIDSGAFDAALPANAHPIARLAYSASGHSLASLDVTGQLLLFYNRSAPGVETARDATSFAFLGDDRLALGTSSGKVLVFDASGDPGREFGDLREPIVNVVTNGSDTLAAQGASGQVLLWRGDQPARRAHVDGSVPGGLFLTANSTSLAAMPADGPPVWLEPSE